MNFSRFIAFRYLKKPRRERSVSVITYISILGIGLGVTALIVVLSIMNGFEKDLRNALIGANAHITITTIEKNKFPLQLLKKTEEKIRKVVPPTSIIVPSTLNQALIMASKQPRGILLKGIQPDLEKNIVSFVKLLVSDKKELTFTQESYEEKLNILEDIGYRKVKTDSLLQPEQNLPGIILGYSLATRLQVKKEDIIKIVSPKERISPFGNLPKIKSFRVVGFFHSGLNGYDEILGFINIEEAQKIFLLESNISSINIYLPDAYTAPDLTLALKENFSFPYVVESWADNNSNLFAVIQLEKLGLSLILTFIILIAAFNIISVLVIIVIEKRKDIAILKSLGARDSTIKNIFILQGMIIGSVGIVMGVTLGLLLCWIIANYSIIEIPSGVYVSNSIPIHIEPLQIALIVFISFIICFIVTLFPSKKAAKTLPVEGLRNE